MLRQCMWAAAAAAAAVLNGACETSNQDYVSGAQIVDVTARPGSYPGAARTAPAQVYDAAGTYQNPQAGLEGTYSSSTPASSPSAYAGTAGAPAASSSAALEPDAPVTDTANYSYTYAQPATSAPAAAGADSGAGVVMPYAPAAVPASAAAAGSSDTYTVVKGDTLYSIAFRYGLDFRALAAANGIEPPYNISVGQRLALNRVASKAPTYVVKKGDTLFSIAKNNGQSVPFLAGVNDLNPPYTLTVGQVLYLARHDSTTTANRAVQTDVPVAGVIKPLGSQTASSSAAAAGSSASASSSQSSSTVSVSASSKSSSTAEPASTTTVLTKPVVVSGQSRTVGGVTWQWPAKGSIIESFSRSEQGNKGIDIAGNRGQQVLAAADGQVVYAGNALRGYGNLVIINHANEYLSAYAHNEVLQVKEGQSVKRGQQIARMGSTDAKSVRLHFEIRYRGQSVNPLSYLPK